MDTNRPLEGSVSIIAIATNMSVSSVMSLKTALLVLAFALVAQSQPVTPKGLNNFKCEPGWSKKQLCGNVYCYKEIDVSPNYIDFKQSVTRDWCKVFFPFAPAYLASVHCKEEDDYIQSLAPESLIGFHIPEKLQNNGMFDVSDFRWTDGSPVDYIGWNQFSNGKKPSGGKKPGYVAYNRHSVGSGGWTNVDYGYKRAICKVKALKK